MHGSPSGGEDCYKLSRKFMKDESLIMQGDEVVARILRKKTEGAKALSLARIYTLYIPPGGANVAIDLVAVL